MMNALTNLPARTHRRRTSAGVTLLEAVMVILVLSAAMVAAPGFSREFLERTHLDADVREVAQTLRLARETAVLHDCRVEVRRIAVNHPHDGQRRHALVWRALPGPYSTNTNLAGSVDRSGSNWLADPIWMSPDTRIEGNPSTVVFQSSNRISRDIRWQMTNRDQQISVTVSAAHNTVEVTP